MYVCVYVLVCVCVCLYVNPTPAPNITSTWNFFAVNCKVLFLFFVFVFAFVLFYFSILILFSPLRPFKFFLIGIVKLMIAVFTTSRFRTFPPNIYIWYWCVKYNIDNKFSHFFLAVSLPRTKCFSHFQIRFYYYLSFSFTTQCGLVRIICNFYRREGKDLG